MRILAGAALVLLALALSSCGKKKAAEPSPVETEEPMEEVLDQATEPEASYVPGLFDIETDYGTIRVQLYEDTPKHLENFRKLVDQHFYDGVLFHRVISGFMIQTGDPFTKDTALVARYGQGGPGYTVDAEILPQHTHKKGALAAARLSDVANPLRESSGSQFYIVLSEEGCRHLDGAYTVFGETVSGLEVVDLIGSMMTDRYDMPLEPVHIITVKPVAVETEEPTVEEE